MIEQKKIINDEQVSLLVLIHLKEQKNKVFPPTYTVSLYDVFMFLSFLLKFEKRIIFEKLLAHLCLAKL